MLTTFLWFYRKFLFFTKLDSDKSTETWDFQCVTLASLNWLELWFWILFNFAIKCEDTRWVSYGKYIRVNISKEVIIYWRRSSDSLLVLTWEVLCDIIILVLFYWYPKIVTMCVLNERRNMTNKPESMFKIQSSFAWLIKHA